MKLVYLHFGYACIVILLNFGRTCSSQFEITWALFMKPHSKFMNWVACTSMRVNGGGGRIAIPREGHGGSHTGNIGLHVHMI